MSSLQIELRPTASLRPNPRNPRTHSQRQIEQIADSIRTFGFTNPVPRSRIRSRPACSSTSRNPENHHRERHRLKDQRWPAATTVLRAERWSRTLAQRKGSFTVLIRW